MARIFPFLFKFGNHIAQEILVLVEVPVLRHADSHASDELVRNLVGHR